MWRVTNWIEDVFYMYIYYPILGLRCHCFGHRFEYFEENHDPKYGFYCIKCKSGPYYLPLTGKDKICR